MSTHLFFIGKGGVGKSTVSSLTGIKLSSEKKVLLVSLDPAHNLSDIFNNSFSDNPKLVSNNLSVIEVNVKKRIKQYLQNIENDLVKSNASLSSFNLLNEFEIIKYSPGIEEYGILLAYSDIIKKYELFDTIIFDMPPTALTLKFFNLPRLSSLWIDKLIDLRNRIKVKKEIVSRIKFGKMEIEKDKILDKLNTQKIFYQFILERLKDFNTEINLVVNPDKLSLSEGEKIITELKTIEFNIKKIILNKATIQQVKLDTFIEIPEIIIPKTEDQLIGIENLKKFNLRLL